MSSNDLKKKDNSLINYFKVFVYLNMMWIMIIDSDFNLLEIMLLSHDRVKFFKNVFLHSSLKNAM